MDITSFSKLISEAKDTTGSVLTNQKSIQHIAKEILATAKSLPLELESSIFYRFNEDDMRFHEFIIAGTEGTPYDSGCFLFKMYCPTIYPDVPPRVNIYTTADGTVSFNPNLYASGKICLSLLGTFQGDKENHGFPINQLCCKL